MSLESLTELTSSSIFDKIIEFEKRYLETYLYLEFPNKVTESGFFYLSGVKNRDSTNPLLEFSNENWNIVVSPLSDVIITARWPESGLFNYKNTIYIFNKIPQRQWKRGVSSGNSEIRNVGASLAQATGRIYYRLDSEILNAAVKEEYPKTIEDACFNLRYSNNIGLAFSREFSIFISPFKPGKDMNEFLLTRNETPVGLIFLGEKKIQIMNEFLQQEIKDLITTEGSLWKLV